MKKLNLLAYPLVAVLSLAAAGAAFADDITPDDTATVQMNAKSREQVQSELFQARKDGTTKVWSTTYNHMTAVKSVKSRDEVQAEVLADRGHAYNVFYGEDSGSFALNRQTPAREAGPLFARNTK